MRVHRNWSWLEIVSDFFTEWVHVKKCSFYKLAEAKRVVCILFRTRQRQQVNSQNLWRLLEAIYKHSYEIKKLRTTV